MELGLEIGKKKLSLLASRASRCVLSPIIGSCSNDALVQAGEGIRGLFVENLHLDEEVVGQPK